MFSHMKIYTVHIKPSNSQAYEKPLFVREGFNWWAFLLTFVWALYQRLWFLALAVFACQFGIVWLGKPHILTPESTGILQLALQVVVGFAGNDWLRAGLSRRGYIVADITAADSLLRAEQRYFERYLAAAH